MRGEWDTEFENMSRTGRNVERERRGKRKQEKEDRSRVNQEEGSLKIGQREGKGSFRVHIYIYIMSRRECSAIEKTWRAL